MENLASFIALTSGGRPNTVIPCIKVLRGIDVASRQQGATFALQFSIAYQSGGQTVSQSFGGVIKNTTIHNQIDNMWTDIHTPTVELRAPADAGTMYDCSVKITITDSAGSVIDTSLLDTQSLRLG
jgi:hypothetical protein